MALPASGPLTLAQVRGEFHAPAGTPLHAFVRGGAYVPNISANSRVPTAPPITLHQLLGATAYTPPVISGPSTIGWDGSPGPQPINWYTTSGQTVTGGNASKTASWVRISGSTSIIAAVTDTIAGSWYATTGRDFGNPIPTSTISAVWRLTINDGTSTVSRDITFVFTNEGNE